MEAIEDKIIGICMREFKYDCGEPEQAAARRQIRALVDQYAEDIGRGVARVLEGRAPSRAENLRIHGSSP